MGEEKYIDTKDIADTLGISIRKAQELILTSIPHHRVDPKKTQSPFRVAVSDFRAYLESTKVTPQAVATKPAPAPWPKGVRKVV